VNDDDEEIVKECTEMFQIEDRDEIQYLLRKLSPEQKEAVILRYGEQLSYMEIAKVMECNLRTAQSRIRSALKIMRKKENE
jgi:RNA polymerase sigma-70 factor (ECF subfamily)